MAESFPAFVIEEEDGGVKTGLRPLTLDALPNDDILVEIAYSCLNYKDGLAICGNRNKIARKLPMVAGIDLAGTIIESSVPEWQPGEKIIVNGFGLSETHWGGYARYQRLRPEWLIRLPEAFSFEQAMAIGTAGYTAALCVEALEDWGSITPGSGEVLVTGAAGGVGSVAIALLAKAGYLVTASTGRPESHAYLRSLGAAEIIDRRELAEKGPPLQKERWSGAVDCVGGQTLVNVIAQTVYRAAVAACGLAGGHDLPGTVLPHILRGVALLGVDSVLQPLPRRELAWARLARDLDPEKLKSITRTEPMSKLPQLGQAILAGQIQGRVVIDVTQ
jgi:acrylyl-CoA reductase (NADPH)